MSGGAGRRTSWWSVACNNQPRENTRDDKKSGNSIPLTHAQRWLVLFKGCPVRTSTCSMIDGLLWSDIAYNGWWRSILCTTFHSSTSSLPVLALFLSFYLSRPTISTTECSHLQGQPPQSHIGYQTQSCTRTSIHSCWPRSTLNRVHSRRENPWFIFFTKA